MRQGAWRILSGARAMMRPMVEMLGSARPCWARPGGEQHVELGLAEVGVEAA
jgi:hypothetical protein